MFCEPKGGWRHVEVTERRTAVDFAHQMRWLVDQAYPHARVVRLVLDNLNTHKLGSLYEAFGASEARRIAKRLEFHHTPTHGSWLNMAEIELSVFSRQCLNRRVGDEVLRREVAALERERNDAGAVIDWRFSTQDARSKLQHIYPSGLNGNGTSFTHCVCWAAVGRCVRILAHVGGLPASAPGAVEAMTGRSARLASSPVRLRRRRWLAVPRGSADDKKRPPGGEGLSHTPADGGWLRPAVRRPVVRTAVSTAGPPAKLVDLYRERLSGAGVRRSGVSQESSGSSETW